MKFCHVDRFCWVFGGDKKRGYMGDLYMRCVLHSLISESNSRSTNRSVVWRSSVRVRRYTIDKAAFLAKVIVEKIRSSVHVTHALLWLLTRTGLRATKLALK